MNLHPRGRPVALPWRQVAVEEVTDGMALCVDNFGHHISIPVSVTRAKGLNASVGDVWLIDMTVGGRWTFAACLKRVPPVITGSRDGSTALEHLLEALEEAGVIVDETIEFNEL